MKSQRARDRVINQDWPQSRDSADSRPGVTRWRNGTALLHGAVWQNRGRRAFRAT